MKLIFGVTKDDKCKSTKFFIFRTTRGKSCDIVVTFFTGTIRDVKLLANKLHKVGYTCYVPAYEGHGLLLENLLEYDTDDWLKTAQAGYRF